MLPALHPLHDPHICAECIAEQRPENPCKHGLRVGERLMRGASGLEVAEVLHDLSESLLVGELREGGGAERMVQSLEAPSLVLRPPRRVGRLLLH